MNTSETSIRGCKGCGTPLVPNKAPGRPRVWCSDRCRKVHTYINLCVDCGKRLNPSDPPGSAKASTRCVACAGARSRMMTRSWVLESMREWAELYGAPPSAMDWNPQMARKRGRFDLAERFEADPGRWPSVTAVQDNFGSWRAGVAKAGFVAMAPGERRGDPDEWKQKLSDSLRVWTEEDVLEAIRRWARRHGGRPPSTSDWRPVPRGYPCPNVVARRFGSWSAGIRAAGFEPWTPARRWDRVAA